MYSTDNIEILTLYKQQDALMNELMILSNQIDDVVGSEEGKKMRENWDSITDISETAEHFPTVQANYLKALNELRSLKSQIAEKEKYEKHTEMTTLRLSIVFNTLMKMVNDEKQNVQTELSNLTAQISELQKQVKTLNSFGCGNFAPYEDNNSSNILPQFSNILTQNDKHEDLIGKYFNNNTRGNNNSIEERKIISCSSSGLDGLNKDTLLSKCVSNTTIKQKKSNCDECVVTKPLFNPNSESIFNQTNLECNTNKSQCKSIPSNQVPTANQYINQYASV